MKLFVDYLNKIKFHILLMLFPTILTGIIFLLYQLPLEPVLYIALLWLLTGLGAYAVGFHNYRKKIHNLQMITAAPDISLSRLEAPSDEADTLQQEIMHSLNHMRMDAETAKQKTLEEMTDYRTFILEFYTENQKNEFQKAPEAIWKWIQQNIQEHPELDDSEIVGTPDGVLRLMQGTGMSKRILFVAICRTFGIPARINTVNLQAEYWKHGQFMVPGADTEESSCLVTFSFPDSKAPVYGQSWSIGRLEGTDFVTLDLTDLSLSAVSIPAGTYRLITTNRLPNGNQYAKETIYVLQSGEEKNIPVCIRKLKLDDMRVSNRLDDFELKPKTARFSQIAGTHANILAFLVPGEEPTEHVLNEFLMQKEKWNAWITGSTDACLPNSVVPGDTHQNSIDQGNTGRGRAVHMVLQYPSDLENRTLQKVLQEIPGIQIWYGDFDELVEPLARRMYVDPDKLPLLIVTDPGMMAVYGCSGYHVGSVGLMLELLK